MKMKRIPKLFLLLVALGCPVSLTAQGPTSESEIDVEGTPDVVYGHKDGMALTFDVFRPRNAHGGAVLYMVSGGWVSRWSCLLYTSDAADE